MEAINQELLKNKAVQQEISRHRWLESEKAGRDIGFESAAQDWLNRFSSAWMQYNMPQKKKELLKEPSSQKTGKPTTTRKTRRASSYYQ